MIGKQIALKLAHNHITVAVDAMELCAAYMFGDVGKLFPINLPLGRVKIVVEVELTDAVAFKVSSVIECFSLPQGVTCIHVLYHVTDFAAIELIAEMVNHSGEELPNLLALLFVFSSEVESAGGVALGSHLCEGLHEVVD